MYFNTNWGHDLFATTILREKIQFLANIKICVQDPIDIGLFPSVVDDWYWSPVLVFCVDVTVFIMGII